MRFSKKFREASDISVLLSNSVWGGGGGQGSPRGVCEFPHQPLKCSHGCFCECDSLHCPFYSHSSSHFCFVEINLLCVLNCSLESRVSL